MSFLPQAICYDPSPCCTPVQIPGPQGAAGVGTNGVNGISSFTSTLASFIMPASAANATVSVASSVQFAIGMYVWVEGAGEMQVISKPTVGSIELQNTGLMGNTAALTVIPSNELLTATGKSGTPGAVGAAGSGSPEGVVAASPGQSYVNTSNGEFYFKISGVGTSGWYGPYITS